VLVVAGPNGAGKSTITAALDIVGVYVNADDIKAAAGLSDLEAAQEAERIREGCLAAGLDFSFETVLSTDRNLALLRRAKQAGYRIEAVIVVTRDPELCVLRVAGRVRGGGHNVPANKVRLRFRRSLANVAELVSLSDSCAVFDNSGDLPVVIYRKTATQNTTLAAPGWTAPQISALVESTPEPLTHSS
jgi:predicted ABC-type ATPase